MKFACINRTDENSKKVEKDLIKKMEDEGHILDEINPRFPKQHTKVSVDQL